MAADRWRMPDLADVDGLVTPLAEARVPVLDRGFLFGDAVYEVIRAYAGRPFRLRAHIERLRRSCEGLRIVAPPADDLERRGLALLQQSALSDARIYYQISRGAAPTRATLPPPGLAPSVVVVVEQARPLPEALYEAGVPVVTVAEARWSRVDLKTTNLVPRILAGMAARDEGAYEALWVSADGRVLEGTATNVFAVVGRRLVTPPLGSSLLAGITRSALLELAPALGMPVDERDLPLAELLEASEVLLTGTTTEVLPVVQIDGGPVGAEVPGPIGRRLRQAYRERIQQEVQTP